MKRLSAIVLIFAAAIAFSSCHQKSKDYPTDESGEYLEAEDTFPILAWWGIPEDCTTPERFRELRECGFTHNFTHDYTNADSLEKALDMAQQEGIKMLINTTRLPIEPEEVARRFKDHPALGGYYIMDEPPARKFEHWAEVVRNIQAIDSTTLCYINMLPNVASQGMLGTETYQEYVNKFDSIIPVQILTFDHYPILNTGLRAEYFENMEIISAKARETGKPFWAFILSTAHGPYPIPDDAELRLQAFTDLAYGAQLIQYFTYWDPRAKVDFHHSPIDKDNKRTDVWDKVRTMNQRIRALSGVFLGCKVLSVNHTGDTIPAGTKPLTTLPEGFTSLETEGEGAIVSQIENKGKRFVVIVNRDYKNRMNLHVGLPDGMKRILPDGRIADAALYADNLIVEPGDAVIYMY